MGTLSRNRQVIPRSARQEDSMLAKFFFIGREKPRPEPGFSSGGGLGRLHRRDKIRNHDRCMFLQQLRHSRRH